jgi:hypothetical protein
MYKQLLVYFIIIKVIINVRNIISVLEIVEVMTTVLTKHACLVKIDLIALNRCDHLCRLCNLSYLY